MTTDPSFDDAFLLRPFDVTVEGFGTHVFHAASRGRALSDAWNSYVASRGVESGFGDFMRIAKAVRGEVPARYGEAILVGGRPAFLIGFDGHYVQFADPGAASVGNSHPLDVETPNGAPFRR